MIFTEKQGKQAWTLHKAIVANEEIRRQLFADNIRFLSDLKDTGLYQAILGDEVADFHAYLGQLEVFYSRNQIRNYLAVNDKFIKELKMNWKQIQHIPISRLFDLVTIVNDDTVDEWLDKARVLTTLDGNNELREIKGKITSDKCEHPKEKQVDYGICQDCGFKHRK